VTYSPAPIQGNYLTQFTVNYARYALFQKTCIVNAKVTITGAGGAIAGQPILMTLPFNSAAQTAINGSFYYFDSGTANYVGTTTGSAITNYWVQNIVSGLGAIGTSPAVTVAVNDIFQITVCYEVA
jgi:hypothetical protein